MDETTSRILSRTVVEDSFQHVYIFRTGLMHIKFEETPVWVNFDQQNSGSFRCYPATR